LKDYDPESDEGILLEGKKILEPWYYDELLWNCRGTYE
jgi:hypothetical protein